jgi:hypothetical protein
LNTIHAEIQFNASILEIDRTATVNLLEENLSDYPVLILSGIGGVGKTAVIKKLYERVKEKTHFYFFKASEFDINLIDNFFGKYSLQNFIDVHNKNEEKIIVIDSAEKLLEFNIDPFKEFLSALTEQSWKFVFTTRYSYLDDLNYQFTQILNIIPYKIDIKNLSNLELEALSNDYKFNLPQDYKLLKLIKNPFYLNEYLSFYNEMEEIDYQAFKNKIWNQNIKKSNPNREKCFLDLVFKRAKQGQFYVNIDCQQNSLEELKKRWNLRL